MPFQKGNTYAKLKRGVKHYTTLNRELRRAIFDEEVSKKWKEIVNKLPPTYVADQFIGKAKDTVEHKIDFIFDEDAKNSVEKLVE